ncbi:MAG: hypothetical protein HKO71_00085 [Pseudomonadales bacterium]|nr:hypothetical protein [Pseudomonadales bacterium]
MHEHPSQSAPAKPPIRVPTWPLVAKNWAAKHVGYGTLEKLEAFTIDAPQSGRIDSIRVAAGEQLDFGAAVLSLDQQQPGQALADAERVWQHALQRYRQAASNFDRRPQGAAAMSQGGPESIVASQVGAALAQQLAQSRSALARADAQRQRALLAVMQTDLATPLTAMVRAVPVQAGAAVQAGQPLLQLQPLAAIAARVTLPAVPPAPGAGERDAYWPGQSCRLKTAALRGRLFSATLLRLVPAVQAASGANSGANSAATNSALIVLDNPQQLLKPGMPVRVQCEGLWREQALVVPRKALLASQAASGLRNVYVLAEGRVHERQPVFGQGDSRDVPVLAGLQQGEQLVIGKQHMLEPGVAAQVLKWVQVSVKDEF